MDQPQRFAKTKVFSLWGVMVQILPDGGLPIESYKKRAAARFLSHHFEGIDKVRISAGQLPPDVRITLVPGFAVVNAGAYSHSWPGSSDDSFGGPIQNLGLEFFHHKRDM
ncbi:hypothetical protein MPH_07300 [Macrophomina phaseolina MS6]|uniref:Uncharacterized protein n=1 Tax=Macrophomina phaseolina (strain MS6) TaxID=1126212 RepID=K2RLC6_MACPH|nr:hypothetical protein MPH_07300 [Macrophomina phaseolina MS6]